MSTCFRRCIISLQIFHKEDVTFQQIHTLMSRRGGVEAQRLLREAREAVENETADHNQAMRVLVAQMVADNLLDHAGGVEAQRLLRKAREAVENETADHSQEVRVQTAQKAKANMAATGNTKWDEKFTLAVQYKDEHKQWPPQSQGVLGTWVDHQRTQKKKFDKDPTTSTLTQERIDKLNKVGFAWNPGKGKGGGGNRRKSLRQ